MSIYKIALSVALIILTPIMAVNAVEIDFSGISSLRVIAENGRVDVVAVSAGPYSASTTADCGGGISTQVAGAELTISTDEAAANCGLVAYIPVNLVVFLQNDNTAISFRGSAASLSVSAGNGGITALNTGGPAQLISANGKILTHGTEGALNVTTGNGSIVVKSHKGPFNLKTKNGRVNVSVVEVTQSSKSNVSSSNGSISIRKLTSEIVKPGVRAGIKVSARSGNGSVQIISKDTKHATRDGVYLKGPLSASLKLRTSNGDVLVK